MSFAKTLEKSLEGGAEAATRSKDVTKWLTEITDARKREKEFRKEASRCVDIYEAETSQSNSQPAAYNILYANTETLAPALYNSTPRPVVKKRQKKDDPKAQFVSKILQKSLEYLTDADEDGYSPFDELQKTAVMEALVPGRGITRFRYTPTISSAPGAEEGSPPVDKVDYETVCGEEVPWDRLYLGYAKTWPGIPWMAFEHFFTREECVENFGEEVGNAIKLTAVAADKDDNSKDKPADAEGVKFAHVYEIWDKASKLVFFLSEGMPEKFKEVQDPLKLTGFFPVPRQLVLLRKISSIIPKPLYLMYEQQAQELDIITKRITAITKALKIRGFYDSTLSGIDDLMKKEDNALLPAANVAALQEGGGLERAIWLMPIEKLVAVLQQLYINRQQVKQVIYEITGIADILRGSSSASETLGAQKIKEAWGTLRLKRQQKEVQRYSRDCLRMMAELASNHFSAETFARMTGFDLPTVQAKAEAQQFLQQAQMAAQQQPQPGMPPPQQPDPRMMEKAQQAMTLPTWDEVLAILRDDLQRSFLIDIETNSTIDAEATEDKEQVAEFMNAMGQLLNGLMPAIESGFMNFEVAKGLMLAIVQKFRFGGEVEDELKKMQAPPPKTGVDPAAEAKAAALKQDAAHQQQVNQLQLQQMGMDGELKKMENQAKMQKLQRDMQLAEAKFAADMKKLGMEVKVAETGAQVAEVKADASIRVAEAGVKAAEAPKPTPKAS